ncbi:hypothetical protein ACIHIX_23990 [Streptomyces sp. NPDC051913]|uniref:hypothetical protein n=1 Tax=Streptomyces sp. NPDC051913 TaxID=3365676 RepID=UPI0037CDA3C4
MEAAESDLHAEFCRELAILRLISGPRRAALEQAVRQVREGAAIAEVLDGLGFDLLDRQTLRGGLPTRAADTPGPPVPGTYLCPLGACHRTEKRYAGQGPPECLVHERVLTFVPDA